MSESIMTTSTKYWGAFPSAACAWDWKRKLTFSGNVSATDLDDFPVLVHLTVANFDFNKAQALGQDIRFMDTDTCPSDGVPLKHEIELWDKPGNNAWVWVKVPRIDGGSAIDFIYMFYGNGVAADGQDAVNVWTAVYEGVYHLRNTNDSTANAFNGAAQGHAAPIAAGQADGAYTFDGTTDVVNCGIHAEHDFGEAYTAMGWLKNNAHQDNCIVSKFSRKLDPAGRGWIIQCFSNVWNWSAWITVGAVQYLLRSNVAYDTDWHHVALTYDGEELILYLDGNNVDSSNLMSGACDSSGKETGIGAALNVDDVTWSYSDCNGDIDEVRLMAVTRTPDWVMGQFKAQNDTLITYGAEQPA